MNIQQLNNLSYSKNNNINNRLEETYDDLEEERRKIKEEMEETDELELSNQYKTRIIDSEINSNLHLQILIYFNFCFYFVCFALELSSICFKIYIYDHDPVLWIIFALEFVWVIIEPIKLYNGYYGNINENVNKYIYNIIYIIQFYNLLLFFLTGLFGIGIQCFLAIESEITLLLFPIEFSCIVVYAIFSFTEIFLGLYTMFYIGNRQAALFYLRNSAIVNQNQREKIKTSQEIEQELYYKFPYLKNLKKPNNNEHLKNN